MTEVLILLAIGVFAGVYSGVLGIGGGLVIVPALVMFMNMSQKMAQGTSLAVMIPPLTLLSTYIYYKAGHVDLKAAIWICLGFFLGGYFGGRLAVMIPELILRRMFAIFLVIVALNMFFTKKPG